ncbi:MAG: hypothetical protein AAF560_26275 [Acidobacteriota bacterium]
MTVTPTDRPELQRLMTNEFHLPGEEDFVGDQLDSYVQRLSASQLSVLDTLVDNELMAFITLGDGYFDYPMSAGFSELKTDNVRPNASFALFYRVSPQDVHLVYYTRFFTVSYAEQGFNRRDCHRYDATTDPIARAALKKQIYRAMQLIPAVHKHFTPTDRSHTENFRLRLDTRGFFQDLDFTHSTWIVLEEQVGARWRIPDWLKKQRINTLHGMINTGGCWMFQRNLLFEWPNEIGPAGNARFERYAKAYVAARKDSDWHVKYNEEFEVSLPAHDANLLLTRSFNPAYLEFLRAFIGVRPLFYQKTLSQFPPHAVTVEIGSEDEVVVNLPSAVEDYYRKELMRFDDVTSTAALQGKTLMIDGSLPLDQGRTRLLLIQSLPARPAAGDIIQRYNAWGETKPKDVFFGPNAFGDFFDKKVFAKDRDGGRGFAEVYLWKQKDGFTSLDGTRIEAW